MVIALVHSRVLDPGVVGDLVAVTKDVAQEVVSLLGKTDGILTNRIDILLRITDQGFFTNAALQWMKDGFQSMERIETSTIDKSQPWVRTMLSKSERQLVALRWQG